MNVRRLLYSALLVLLSLWLGWTVLVDFVVVPAVFRNINNFFEAGDLGIYLFTKFNFIEMILASVTLVALVFIFRKNRAAMPLLISAVIVIAISLSYFTFVIPKLTHLTELWKLAEAGKLTPTFDIQQEHQFYHRIYVGLDTAKIAILAFMMGTSIGKEKWTA